MVKVEIFHNVAEDERRGRVGPFGYEPEHELVKVFEFETEDRGPVGLAELAYQIGNGAHDMSQEYYSRKLRPLNVGDVVRIEDTMLRYTEIGWDYLRCVKDITDEYEGGHGTQPWRD